jgi:DNA recombination protein RmuC
MDFAFMFIPSEWIYYDLLVNKIWNIKINTTDLIEYAFKEKKVILTSPTSFYAYLQTVMQWLRAMQIEEIAKDIQRNVWKLARHINSYETYLNKVWVSLWTTVNHYNNAYREFSKIDKDILKITMQENSSEINILELEKPNNQ